MKMGRPFLALCAFAGLMAAATVPAQGQSAAGLSGVSFSNPFSATTPASATPTSATRFSATVSSQGANPQSSISTTQTTHAQPGFTYRAYQKPTHHQKFTNYLFDAFGPYSIVGSIGAGSIHQATNAPPDWGQGWQAWGARVGSAYGVSVVTQTTRYAVSELLREDTIYYRCECTGTWPRIKHAVISTVTARKGDDGHRVFSIPAILAPYAGSETAALVWYPSRFGAKDGFRMGNYNLLDQVGMNLGLEFIWGGPHTLLNKVHVPIVSNVTGSTATQDKP
ncbi:MAG: hypothetical protein WA823_03035 [Candidatus Acidiferrales bacterium]